MVVMPTINYLAVVVAAVVAIVFGLVWYSPILFGGIWSRGNPTAHKKMQQNVRKGGYVFMIIASLLTSFALEVLIKFLGINTLYYGVGLAMLVWAGFFFSQSFVDLIMDSKDTKLFVVDNTHHIVSVLLICIILVLMG